MAIIVYVFLQKSWNSTGMQFMIRGRSDLSFKDFYNKGGGGGNGGEIWNKL